MIDRPFIAAFVILAVLINFLIYVGLSIGHNPDPFITWIISFMGQIIGISFAIQFIQGWKK